MGKVKSNTRKFGHKVPSPGPLAKQILDSKYAKPTGRVKGRNMKQDSHTKKFINATGVLSQVRVLGREIAKENPVADDQLGGEEEEEELMLPEHVEAIIRDFEMEMKVDMTEEESIFISLMPESAIEKKNMSFMEQVKESLIEKKTEIQTQIDEESIAAGDPLINSDVQEICAKVGEVLRSYRSGPVPKVMKAIPKMKNWQHLLYYTCPDKWSAAAMFQLTRVFCSQRADVAQIFYNKVLLPRCRDDVNQYKKLNSHLFAALRKAIFKPAAFFKGFILPLCLSRDCTLREAIVFGTVIQKKSIPILVSGAAIVKICQMEYSGANSIFLRILLNKKYSLQWSVIDAVCAHFVSFRTEIRRLPVLWHECLLIFVQRYKEQISEDQKKQLYGLACFHAHRQITPEVRRELENSASRGPPMPVKRSQGTLII